MSVAVLTLMKLVLLGGLYLFIYRVVRAIIAELYGPARGRAAATPRRPAVAEGGGRKPGRAPREIVIHAPDGQPRVVALGGDSVTLGRSAQATIAVDDIYVSDEHALISPNEDGWVVRDLGSTNGTYLNGAKVTQPTPLAAGDQLRLGKTRIEVRR
jgi:hypothetical protein